MERKELTTLNCEGKGFLALGTSKIKSWTDGDPFAIFMSDLDDFNEHGFTGEDFERCQQLEVGENVSDLDYEGLYIIRVC